MVQLVLKNLFISWYRSALVRPALYSFHTHLYKFALRGMGILNSEGPQATGEDWLQAQIAQFLEVNTIVDVGANTDVFGIDAFPAAQIYACEPHPLTFKKLKANYANSEKATRLQLFNIALSNKAGKMSLWDFADDAELKDTQPTSTLASLDRSVIEELHHQSAKSYRVTVSTLDDFVKKNHINSIDILKIDTEGHELAVLHGATKTLRLGNIKIIQFEFNEMNAFSRTFLRDFISLLPDYAFFRLLPNGVISLDNYRPLTHEIFAFQNIVCIHKSVRKQLKFLK
jgi:FkbM family methyltransferase